MSSIMDRVNKRRVKREKKLHKIKKKIAILSAQITALEWVIKLADEIPRRYVDQLIQKKGQIAALMYKSDKILNKQ